MTTPNLKNDQCYSFENLVFICDIQPDLYLGKTWYLTLRDNCTVRIPAVKCLVLLAHTLESQLKPCPRGELTYQVFHDFLKSLHATAGTVPQIRPQLLPSTFTPINDSLIILSFDTTQSDLINITINTSRVHKPLMLPQFDDSSKHEKRLPQVLKVQYISTTLQAQIIAE